ncbi:MAG: hypothetical protein K2W95_05880 [Candidatus Obscuribacterales bacterium]|nr:hypothetical protein [Candidatus Obscuribacterales bacterium]
MKPSSLSGKREAAGRGTGELPRQASRPSTLLHHLLEHAAAALVVGYDFGLDLEGGGRLIETVAAVEQHRDLRSGFQVPIEPEQ